MIRRLLLAALLLVAALPIGACGDDAGGSERGAQLAVPGRDPDGGLPIGGWLAIDPAECTLWSASNTGRFRVPGAGREPVKVTGTLTTPDGQGEISEQSVGRFTG